MKVIRPTISERSCRSDIFPGVDLDQVADCLRAVAHPDRLLLIALLLEETLPVGALAERLGLPQPVVSGHLRILHARGLLVAERQGQRTLYRAATPALANICTCIRSHFSACGRNGS